MSFVKEIKESNRRFAEDLLEKNVSLDTLEAVYQAFPEPIAADIVTQLIELIHERSHETTEAKEPEQGDTETKPRRRLRACGCRKNGKQGCTSVMVDFDEKAVTFTFG